MEQINNTLEQKKSINMLLKMFFTCALLTASTIVKPMDGPKVVTPEIWVLKAGKAMLGKQSLKSVQEAEAFLKLPSQIRSNLIASLRICTQPAFLQDIRPAISNLVAFSEELNILINDPDFSLKLIKHYSKMFHNNNETVCEIMATEETNRHLTLQRKFLNSICKNSTPDSKTIKEFRESNFDTTFTDKNGNTPGEICILEGNYKGLKNLLDVGASPEPLYNMAIEAKSLNKSRQERGLIIGMLLNAINKKWDKKSYNLQLIQF